MSTEMRADFTVNTRLRGVSGKWERGNRPSEYMYVCASERPGLVMCAATNCYVLVVAEQPGHAVGWQMVPTSILPASKGRITGNGSWECGTKSALPSDRMRQYPFAQVMPQALPDNRITFNAKQLRAMLDAIGGTGASDTVTLAIGDQSEKTTPVCAVGPGGVGVIMPCDEHDQYAARWQDLRSRYAHAEQVSMSAAGSDVARKLSLL